MVLGIASINGLLRGKKPTLDQMVEKNAVPSFISEFQNPGKVEVPLFSLKRHLQVGDYVGKNCARIFTPSETVFSDTGNDERLLPMDAMPHEMVKAKRCPERPHFNPFRAVFHLGIEHRTLDSKLLVLDYLLPPLSSSVPDTYARDVQTVSSRVTSATHGQCGWEIILPCFRSSRGLLGIPCSLSTKHGEPLLLFILSPNVILMPCIEHLRTGRDYEEWAHTPKPDPGTVAGTLIDGINKLNL
jgi:hypothetical protein